MTNVEFTPEMIAKLSSPEELKLPERRSYLCVGGSVYQDSSIGKHWFSRTLSRAVLPEHLLEVMAAYAKQDNVKNIHWWVEGF